MAKTLKEVVYIGRDNAIDFQLQDDTVVPGTLANTDMSGVTKIAVVVDATDVYDSDVDPEVISFTAGGIVSMQFGDVFDAVGEHSCELIVYDATNTDGVSWEPRFTLEIRESGVASV